MQSIVATTGNAGPWAFIILGAILAFMGALLASNFRGIGSKYIQLALSRQALMTDSRKKLVQRYRAFYGLAAVLGCLLVISGVSRL
jgi:hypothetical protein